MILLVCFDLFVQKKLFYIKETDLSIFLELKKKLPSSNFLTGSLKSKPFQNSGAYPERETQQQQEEDKTSDVKYRIFNN